MRVTLLVAYLIILVKYIHNMSDKLDVSRITKVADENADPTDKDNKRLLERSDSELQARLRSLRQFRFRSEDDLLERFPYPDELTEDEGVYDFEGYIVLDKTQISAILSAEYATLPASTGRAKFVSHLRRYIGISNLEVSNFLKGHNIHQLYTQKRRSSRAVTSVSSGPYKVIVCDITFIVPVLNAKYLLVMVDQWSKYTYVKLLSNMGATVANAIREILRTMPTKVGALKTDNGTEFKSATMTNMLKEFGTKQIFSTPGVPTSNAQVESQNKHIKEAMYSILHDTKKDLPSVQAAIEKAVKMLNTTVNKAHGFMPSALNKPIEELPQSIIDEVNKRLASNAEQTAPNLRYHPYLQQGSKIRISLEELDPKVQQAIKNGSYKASHNQTFSSKVFTVKKQDALNRVSTMEHSFTFSRGACLLVPDDAKDVTKELEKPVVAQKGKRKPSQTDGIAPTRKLRSAANG
jgi:transposase InsO family protein